jgi:RNA polymerase sigma-70 factor (ECF subfamily)
MRALDRVVLWVAILSGSATVRLAGAGYPSRGLPLHLAASAELSAAGVIRRATSAPPVDEDEIDPEIVEHVRGAQEGNAYSFSILYDRYVDKVYAYCYHRVGDRQTAEDLTADVFMRALKRIGTFTWQGKDFGAWLITIARNRCHDHFKSSRFRLESSVAEVYDSTTPPPTYDARPERGLELADLRAQVHAGLAQLKSEQAEVLYHRFLQGCDVETTARIMGKNEGAIRALQYRALKALSKHVDVEALV